VRKQTAAKSSYAKRTCCGKEPLRIAKLVKRTEPHHVCDAARKRSKLSVRVLLYQFSEAIPPSDLSRRP
jgi:hypothetical protein